MTTNKISTSERSNKKKTRQNIKTNIALILSILAVLGTIYHQYWGRSVDSAKLTPSLRIGLYNNPHAIALYNSGPGSAILKYLSIYVDDEPKRTWQSVLVGMGFEKIPPYEYTYPFSSGVFPPNYSTLILKLISREDGEIFWKNRKRVRVELCYCSILGQCWLNDSRKPQLKEDSCDDEGKVIFGKPRPH